MFNFWEFNIKVPFRDLIRSFVLNNCNPIIVNSKPILNIYLRKRYRKRCRRFQAKFLDVILFKKLN